MVNLTINGIPLQAEEHMTILTAAASAGITIPTLCYLKDINEIGACRVCVVEIEGVERLQAACNATVSEGMAVYTNSPKVREARRINVELILSQHNDHCASCARSGNCTLQTLCNDLGITELEYHSSNGTNFKVGQKPLEPPLPTGARCGEMRQVYALRADLRPCAGSAHLGRCQHRLAHDDRRFPQPLYQRVGLRAVRAVHHALPGRGAAGTRRHG